MNSIFKNIGNSDPISTITKTPIIERTHFSGPSGGSGVGTYHIHHGYDYSGHSSHGSGKHSIALTALTLLSFLFFLNILQNCLQEHMDQMNPQQVIIMQARLKAAREAEAEAEKRKGETPVVPFTNQSIISDEKEPRISPDSSPSTLKPTSSSKPRYQYDKLTQIPIKLKAVEKYKIHQL